MVERKPPTRLDRRLERREIPRTFRFTESEDAALQEGAVTERVDFSTYCRDCLLMGHSFRQAQRLMKATGG
jgi:hypothetical protein